MGSLSSLLMKKGGLFHICSFIPYGVPGPYRVLLGIRKADKKEEERS